MRPLGRDGPFEHRGIRPAYMQRRAERHNRADKKLRLG